MARYDKKKHLLHNTLWWRIYGRTFFMSTFAYNIATISHTNDWYARQPSNYIALIWRTNKPQQMKIKKKSDAFGSLWHNRIQNYVLATMTTTTTATVAWVQNNHQSEHAPCMNYSIKSTRLSSRFLFNQSPFTLQWCQCLNSRTLNALSKKINNTINWKPTDLI